MDVHKVFTEQGKILGKALPALTSIHWPDYGSKFSLRDDAGRLKYQGVMRRYYIESDISIVLTLPELPDEKLSFAVLGRKLEALAKNPRSKVSLWLRDPPEVWGGAIRSHLGITGITGLPETVDHLVETHLSWHTDQLSRYDFNAYIHGEHDRVIAARNLVGMTLTQWDHLSAKISGIIRTAAN